MEISRVKSILLGTMLFCFVFVLFSEAQVADRQKAWSDISKWVRWKLSQSISKTQRDTLLYLSATQAIVENIELIHFSSEKTTNVNTLSTQFVGIKVPVNCRKYNQVLVAMVSALQKGDEKQIMICDAEMFSEFFNLLKSAGLFERYETELRLINET